MFCVSLGALVLLRHTYLVSFFLDLEDVVRPTLGAVWDLKKGTALWGRKALSRRPTCSGTKRARTHLLLYSIVRIIRKTYIHTLFETCRGFSFKAVWYV
jgi:hypothetical protein